MNIDHLRYVLEVEKCGSISQAAKSLYLNQPYLSKVIGELEEELNLRIFERSNKGIQVTPKGRDVLTRISHIVDEVDELDHLYKGFEMPFSFSVAVPTASYISAAFHKFIKEGQPYKNGLDVAYHETNPTDVVDLVTKGECNLGILRVFDFDRDYYNHLFEFKNLQSQVISSFACVLLMSESNSLAGRKHIDITDLKNQILIRHATDHFPKHTVSYLNDIIHQTGVTQSIEVFERASQLELLENLEDTFMLVSPMPTDLLEKYHLITRPLNTDVLKAMDLLIYRRGYTLSPGEKRFLEDIHKEVQAFE